MAPDIQLPPTQVITVTEGGLRLKPLGKVLLLLVVFLPFAWYVGQSSWDSYVAYSGVVVSKGMDCHFCFLGHSRSLDLYIKLRDETGKITKRYVGTSRGYLDSKRWNEISVGSFVVKDRGNGEYPYVPGHRQPPPTASKGEGWLLFALLLVFGTLFVIRFREFWSSL